MTPDQIDPENIEPFSFPPSLLEKIYEMTGSDSSDGGFIMAFVSSNGVPVIHTKANSPIVEMGLRKALEQYLADIEEMESKHGRLDDLEE